jgi:hypothetical protein
VAEIKTFEQKAKTDRLLDERELGATLMGIEYFRSFPERILEATAEGQDSSFRSPPVVGLRQAAPRSSMNGLSRRSCVNSRRFSDNRPHGAETNTAVREYDGVVPKISR